MEIAKDRIKGTAINLVAALVLVAIVLVLLPLSVNVNSMGILSAGVAQAATLYEYYNTGDDATLFLYGAYWKTQTSTPLAPHTITSVKLKLYRTGSPGTVTVSIRATDGSGHPTGADLCSGTTDGNTLTTNQPSSWHQSRDGYDLVMITHRDFLDNLQPLKKLRESQGLKVALIDVEDLYGEFNFGNKSPKAMKDFLTLAKSNWRKSPRFVLLVGDASYDPRNYLGLGDFDFLPTKLIDTAYMETASDDWFVDLNGDGLPEMAIGRLPVRTLEEANAVVSKIIGYERSGVTREALLVADVNDGFDFGGASEGSHRRPGHTKDLDSVWRPGNKTEGLSPFSTRCKGVNLTDLLRNLLQKI